MKVPTYQKYGITKSQLEKFDERNRKVSQLLTHKLPISAGIVLGGAVYLINLKRFAPTNFFQVIYQLFLLISLSIICVGLLMILFKLIENYYYKRLELKNEIYRNILSFKKDKEEFDYWHIRSDERFWKLIDGFTFEREVTGLLKKLGYEFKTDTADLNKTHESDIYKDGKKIFLTFITNREIESADEVTKLICDKTGYEKYMIVLTKGYKPKVSSELDSNIELISLKDITAMVRGVGE